MIIARRRVHFLLFAGDIAVFIISLYLTLWLRYLEIPNETTLSPYITPFAFLFAFWAFVFYSAGLYSKRILLFSSRLPDALFKTQIANILFAALFFFFIPAFGIAPKTIILLYLVISLVFIILWRIALYPRISTPRARERLTLVAAGPEADELCAEVNGNPRYGLDLVIRSLDDRSVISPYQSVSFEDMYEEVFDRIALSRLGSAWFTENVASSDPIFYTIAKRCVDIVGGLLMGLVTLVITPLVFIANCVEGPGPLFIKQERLGQNGGRITVYKFRSMQKNIMASDEWTHEGENRVTRVGAFLRQTSLDEFPQFINVIRGEISLVGPRNDILGLGKRLAQALPYYKARYLVAPGITGWAQINQQYEQGNVSPQSVEETKVRLAYDFYYLKHRSFWLDIVIAIKTLKRMFFRVSSW